MSYTGARRIPHADGPRHRANYWAAAQILLSNVGGSYAVAMKDEAAQLVRASKHAPSHLALAPVSTLGTSARRVGLFLQGDFHSAPLGLVGEFVPDAAVRPLVEFLVRFAANIQVVSDIAHVANHNGSHACLMQRGDEVRCLLMLNIPDLVLNLLKLLLLGADDPLAPLAAFLHASIDTAIQRRLQLIAVLYL